MKTIPTHRSTGYVAPKDRYVPPVLFNPYTGEPRDARDIQSDPHGVLIVPPGADLLSAPSTETSGDQAPSDAAEPVAWFAFGDSNGPVPLELYGWDEKACKNAVLSQARACNYKGTVEGYLMQQGWTLRPVYLAAPQLVERKAQPVSDNGVPSGSLAHLALMMEHSAWDGRLNLSDALANIRDFARLGAQPMSDNGAVATAWPPLTELPDGTVDWVMRSVGLPRHDMGDIDALRKLVQAACAETVARFPDPRYVDASQAHGKSEAVATLHDDGHYTFKRGQEPWGARQAGWRMDVFAAAPAADAAVVAVPEGWSVLRREDLGGIHLQRGGTGYVFRPTAAMGSHERFAWNLLNDMLASNPSQSTGDSVRVEGDARDAARYRWLRAQHQSNDSGETFVVFQPDEFAKCLQPVGIDELDQTIDVALAKQAAPEAGSQS